MNKFYNDIMMLGWAVPTECPIQNYVDENRMYHQRVGRVKMSNLGFYYDANAQRFITYIPDMKHPKTYQESLNRFYCYPYKNDVSPIEGSKIDMTMSGFNDDNHLYFYNFAYTDVDSLMQSMDNDNVYLYYELQNEIVRPIDDNEHSVHCVYDLQMLGWTVPDECPVQNYVDSDHYYHQRVGRIRLYDLPKNVWGIAKTWHDDYNLFYLGMTNLLQYPIKMTSKIGYVTGNVYHVQSQNIFENTSFYINSRFINSTISTIGVIDNGITSVDQLYDKFYSRNMYLYYELQNEIITPLDGEEVTAVLDNNLTLLSDEVGINLWDEEWELGAYNAGTGNVYERNTSIRSRANNYISIKGSTQYCVNKPISVYYYDQNKTFIINGFVSNGIFTSPANASYMRFDIPISYGTTYNYDICINISNPSINGKYYPYRGLRKDIAENLTHSAELLVDGYMTPVFGDVHNSSDGRTYAKRIGRVDLGSLSWTAASTSFTYYADITNSVSFSEYCDRYKAITSISPSFDKVVSLGSNRIYIRDTTYANATALKASVNGLYLYYAYETPETYNLVNYASIKDMISVTSIQKTLENYGATTIGLNVADANVLSVCCTSASNVVVTPYIVYMSTGYQWAIQCRSLVTGEAVTGTLTFEVAFLKK